MKKAILGLVAVGAVLACRRVVKRKADKMREHCEQMAAKCKLAEPVGDRRGAVAA